jgi:hypothetical protein
MELLQCPYCSSKRYGKSFLRTHIEGFHPERSGVSDPSISTDDFFSTVLAIGTAQLIVGSADPGPSIDASDFHGGDGGTFGGAGAGGSWSDSTSSPDPDSSSYDSGGS